MNVEIVRLLCVFAGTAGGFVVATRLSSGASDPQTVLGFGGGIGALAGYVIGGAFGRWFQRALGVATERAAKIPAAQLLAGAVGGLVGLLAGVVACLPLVRFLNTPLGWSIGCLVVWTAAASGFALSRSRAAELLRFAGLSESPLAISPYPHARHGEAVFIVDTSAVIDGRILDIAKAGFVTGTMYVPTFVLSELQAIADSSDDQRRRRGRRGLEVLAALRREEGVDLQLLEVDVPGAEGVDAKLVDLARNMFARLVTTDHNLSRVAVLHGINTLNPNGLADALRMPVTAGDRITVDIVKEGRESGQGVGYLDDGTMVVVEGGAKLHGRTVTGEVTNVLQTAVGKMVFARLAATPAEAPG